MRTVVCVTQFARESTKSIATPPAEMLLPPGWDATPPPLAGKLVHPRLTSQHFIKVALRGSLF